MLDLNYRASKTLLDACQAQGVRLLYASSAAVYGGSATFREEPRVRAAAQRLRLLEAAVRQRRAPHAADGDDAGRRLSLLQRLRPARAAQGADGVGRLPPLQPVARARPGQAVRRRTAATAPASRRATSSSSSDVVAVNLWFLDHPEASGIFNLGSGRAQPFNDVAAAVVNAAARRARRAAAAARRDRRRRHDRVHRLSAGAGRQVPVLHRGRPGAPARRRLRPRLRRRRERRRPLRRMALGDGA